MATRLKNPYLWAYATAILLHILVLALENPLGRVFILAPQQENSPAPPLTFEFVDVPTRREEARPEKTPLIAERDQIARIDKPIPCPKITCRFPRGWRGQKIWRHRRGPYAQSSARCGRGAGDKSRRESLV